MGRTCGELDEIEKNTHSTRKMLPRFVLAASPAKKYLLRVKDVVW